MQITALVACILLVSLAFDVSRIEGLLLWVQENKAEGSVLFLVGGRGGSWRSWLVPLAEASERCQTPSAHAWTQHLGGFHAGVI